MKSFAEVNQAINKFVISLDSSSSYSLERIETLLQKLGNPQEKFKTLHVAGTSGKTSTSYYAASMLKAAGYKVGLSVSPHIEEVNERVQIGLEPLPEQEFVSQIKEFMSILNTLSIRPTYFELFVSFAYWYFAKASLDYAVVEVGLGGLRDGTNVIERPDKICIITDIGQDHTHILGDTLAKIARQKAGIIQNHNHVFMHSQSGPVEQEVRDRARQKHAVLHHVIQPPDGALLIDLPGFQQRNWTLAKSACEYILIRDNHRQLKDKEWLATTKIVIPGRMEVFEYKGKTIILDGAHNSQKMHAFTASFKPMFDAAPAAILLAIADTKNIYLEEIAIELKKIPHFLIITTFGKGQDMPKKSIKPEKIAKYFDKSRVLAEPDLNKALELLLKRDEDLLLITGSLYLISAVRKKLKNQP